MSEIRPSTILISVVIFTIIVFSGVFLLDSFARHEGGNVQLINGSKYDTFNKTFHRIDNISNAVRQLEGQTNTTRSQTSNPIIEAIQTVGFLDTLIKKSWNVLTTLFNILALPADILVGFTTVFDLPIEIPTLVGFIITIIIVFAIFGAIFQRKL